MQGHAIQGSPALRQMGEWSARAKAWKNAALSRVGIALQVLLALALVATWSPPAMADDIEIGVIKSVTGAASLERGAVTSGAAVGQSLYIGDRLVTAADGSVGFTMADSSRFSIGPNSAIIVSDFKFQPERGLLSLIAELIYGTMAHTTGEISRIAPAAVQIGTPLGKVGVRGTSFAIKQPGKKAAGQ